MIRIVLLLLALTLCGCTKSSDLDTVVDKRAELTQFTNNLKASGLLYEICHECRLVGLDNETLVGYTGRYPPKGQYDRKDLDIGHFEYHTFFIYKNTEDKGSRDNVLYFLYFSEQQKDQYQKFSRYHFNLIRHGKRIPRAEYVGNTVVVSVESPF